MLKDLDLNKLDNPPIQVVWEDYPENFTLVTIADGKHEVRPEFHENKEFLNFILNECREILYANKSASSK